MFRAQSVKVMTFFGEVGTWNFQGFLTWELGKNISVPVLITNYIARLVSVDSLYYAKQLSHQLVSNKVLGDVSRGYKETRG